MSMLWATIAARNADLPQQPNIPVVKTRLGMSRSDVICKQKKDAEARQRKIKKKRSDDMRTAVQAGSCENVYDWAEKYH